MIDALTLNNHNQPKGVQEDERSLLIDYYVQKVSGRLRQLKSPSDSDKKRWIWELLQNAKDCISSEKYNVDVEVIVEDDHIIFKHNGEPFSPKALNSLIWQKSGKDETNAESTGRFGTGFLTTHTLSKNVALESVLIDTDGSMWGVNLNLFREGELAEELKEGIKKTINSVNYFRNPTNTWTIFKYQLKTQTNKESAAAGVNSLTSNIFFTLAFADKINSIKLVTNDKTLLVTKSEETTLEHLKIVRFSVSENDMQSNVSVIFASSAEYCEGLSKKYKQERQLRYSVAIQVSEDTQEILPILPDTPHLYCVFPLVGTEGFHFPVVVNSPDFEPEKERERLLLAGDEFDVERQEITNEGINKKILSNAVILYSEILTYLSNKGWKNIHLLAKGAKKIPSQERDFDKDWYKEKIQAELRRHVLSTPMVETENGFQKLNDIYFPKGDKKELKKIWEFTNDISPEKLPKLELIDEWSKLIWDECHSQTVKELAKQVSEFLNIDALNQGIDWINNLLLFISEVDKGCLDDYALIPNINGDFRSLEYENLSENIGLPNSTFKLLDAFKVDWKDIVVKKGINTIKLPNNKGYKDLSNEINSQIKQKAKSKDDTLLSSILFLLSAIPVKNDNISNDFIEKRKQIWTFSRDIFKDEQPDTFEAEELDETLWDECDEWIVQEMIIKVSTFNSIKGLIELNTSLDVQWLNRFIGFTIPLTKKDLLKQEEYKILPNQYGDFCTSLAKDKSIPPELKEDVFINLGIDLKKELLNEQIDNFVPEKLIEISEVSTRINDFLSSEIENEIKDAVVFRLISLLPGEKNIYQEKLWKHSRVMYGSKVSSHLVTLKNSHSTLWSVANIYVIDKIMSDIEIFTPIDTEEESKSSISQFAEYLTNIEVEQKANWNDFAIIWLSDFIDFLSKNELAIGVIVPNQNNNFCKLEQLCRDEDIHEDLKKILSILDKDKDFRNDLIHSGIAIQPAQPKNTRDIAGVIDGLVEEFYRDKEKKEFDGFKEAIKLLVVEWFNSSKYPYSIEKDYRGSSGNDTINKSLFKWAFNHRFELETNVLSSIEERKYLYGINNQIRQQSIPFDEVKIITQTEYDDLVAEVEKLKINTTEVENLISKFNLTEDRIKLLLELEEKAKRSENGILNIHANSKDNHNFITNKVKIYPERTGNYDSSSNHNKELGMWGEEFVNELLKIEKNAGKITTYEWHKGEALAYDFTIWKKGKKKYIDVKATENSFDTPIGITSSEIKEIFKQRSNYFIYRVYNVDLSKLPNLSSAKYSKHMPFDKLVKDWELLFSQDYPNGIQLSLEEGQIDEDEIYIMSS